MKQNITNDWGMLGRTRRAADQGWRYGDKKTNKYFFPLKCFEMSLCSKNFKNKDFVHRGSIGPILGKYARYVIYILLYPKLLLN